MPTTKIALVLAALIALTHMACAEDMNVITGYPINLTGPGSSQQNVTYHYQWTVIANSVNINNQLTFNGQPVETDERILKFEAPLVATSTDLYVNLYIYATSEGGSPLAGCVDTAYCPRIRVDPWISGCTYVNGYAGDVCSADATTYAYSFTNLPTNLVLKWYVDDNTTAYATATSTNIKWSSKGIGPHHMTLKASFPNNPSSEMVYCVKNIFVVGVPNATINVGT